MINLYVSICWENECYLGFIQYALFHNCPVDIQVYKPVDIQVYKLVI
jgi:hypothetical protein